MRKIIAIPLIILTLFSGVTVNLAFHYCGGQIADKKISLTNTPGSCGMEGDSQHKNAEISRLCCEDRVTSYTFNNIYIPSSIVKDISINLELPVLEIFSISFIDIIASNNTSEALGGPPGSYSPSFVDLGSICILRI